MYSRGFLTALLWCRGALGRFVAVFTMRTRSDIIARTGTWDKVVQLCNGSADKKLLRLFGDWNSNFRPIAWRRCSCGHFTVLINVDHDRVITDFCIRPPTRADQGVYSRAEESSIARTAGSLETLHIICHKFKRSLGREKVDINNKTHSLHNCVTDRIVRRC